MQWNPFSKKNPDKKEAPKDVDAEMEKLLSAPGAPDPKDLNMLQRMALKRLAKMDPAGRDKVMKKAMTPKNINKHKDEILESLEAMRKAGQLSDDQYRLAKKRLGL